MEQENWRGGGGGNSGGRSRFNKGGRNRGRGNIKLKK